VIEIHRHGVLLYDDSKDLRIRVLAALGHEAGQDDLIVLACEPHHNQLLAAAIESARPGLPPPVLLARPDVRSRPAAALATQRRLPRHPSRRASGRIWYIAEPDPGTTSRTWTKARQYEAAANVTLAQYPLTTVCAYPRPTTAGAMRNALMQTHPRLISRKGPTTNAAFSDPSLILATATRSLPTPDPIEQPVLRISGSVTIHEIGAIRTRIAGALAGLPTLIRTDFVAAVNEALTNAFIHGVPPVDISVWATADWVECRVTDHGHGFSDPLTGYQPEADDNRTHTGLWLARQACDDIDAWRVEDGFTVRLATIVTAERALHTYGTVARAEAAQARVSHAHRRHA